MIENCNINFIKNCSNPCKIIQRTSEINVKRNFHFDVPSANNWQRFISGKFNLYFFNKRNMANSESLFSSEQILRIKELK